MFLITILKDLKPFYLLGKTWNWIKELFFSDFQGLQHDIWSCWCHQRSLEAGSGTWIFKKPKKVIGILTGTHINHDKIHHTRNNCLGPIFFSPGESHTKIMLFLLHLGLEDITEVDTEVYSLSWEFSVCAPSGHSTREQQARGHIFEELQNYMQNKNQGNKNKTIIGDLNCTMDKIDRDGENKTQIIYRCCSNYAL